MSQENFTQKASTKSVKKKKIMRESKRLQELIMRLLQKSPLTQQQLLYRVRRIAPYEYRNLKTDAPTVKFNIAALVAQEIITQDEQGLYHITLARVQSFSQFIPPEDS